MKLKQYEQEYEILRQSIMNEWGISDGKTDAKVIKEADNRFYHKFGIEYCNVIYGEE